LVGADQNAKEMEQVPSYDRRPGFNN